MNAEIISVGTEILLGDIINTNAQYISTRFAELGIDVFYQTTVGDNRQRLYNVYSKAFENADIVITTGGLGPTEDDLTKEVGAEFLGLDLEVDIDTVNAIKERFKKMNIEPTENNLKQSYIPKGCIKLENKNGTAPGCIIEKNNKMLIMLPGPPKEMEAMFENSVYPYLKSKQKQTLVSKVVRVADIGESKMEALLKDIIQNSVNPTVAPYAKENEAILRITAKAESQKQADDMIYPVIQSIERVLGENVYGYDNDTIESAVTEMISQRNMKIAVAESCTGGLLAGTIVNCAGVSNIFVEGAVTYTDDAKIRRLSVKKETLDMYGAVSSQIAAEMAEGIAKSANANIGMSTTGIAGPDGGTENKPVGLVYIGLYIDGIVKTKQLNLVGDRQSIRNRTVFKALNWLRLELLHLNSNISNT